MEPIDLGKELEGYTGERPPRTRAEADVYLGDILQGFHIPKGPPPEPPHASLPAFHDFDFPGLPPPELLIDNDGVYFIHPGTGDRINIEPQCQNCGANRCRLTQTSDDPRWLCDTCKGK